MEKVTLYKKDSKGKIRTWSIRTEGADIIQLSGILGSDNLVEHRKTAKGKNVGKSNETTPEEQAEKEALAKITKKTDKAYFHTEEEARNEKVILPMLAKPYEKQSKKIDWDNYVAAQPKLDGQRCLAIIKGGKVKFISRDNKEIKTMDHIKPSLTKLNLDGFILDGELYAHGYSFQENMKLIKKYREGESEKVLFHVYDYISKEPFKRRWDELNLFLFSNNPEYIEKVLTVPIKTEENLKSLHSEFLGEGYEGTIVRHGEAPYKVNGRSANLLKYKDFEDIATPIVDIIPMDARPEQGLVVSEINGEEFKATPKMSFAEREELLRNKEDYIGKTGEFRFFEYTDSGVPRFPNFIGIRNDK